MSSFPLNPGVMNVSYQPMESFSTFLRLATLETMTLPSGPTEFEPCFRTHGLPPISCPQPQLLLLLGDFPLDRGRLSPCPNPHGSPPLGLYALSSYGELPSPAPCGDLPANPAQDDLLLVPLQPEQHPGPPPPAPYGNLQWK